MLSETILIFLIALITNHQYVLGTSFIGRPLVACTLVGAALGDIQQGMMIGVTLELATMGFTAIGAAIPPDMVMGGILGTAFALKTGTGIEIALVIALPIATLGMILENSFYLFVNTGLSHYADRLVTQGRYRFASNINMVACESLVICQTLLTALAFYFGGYVMERIVNAIPSAITDGMLVAMGLLPAVGLSMLLTIIWSPKVAPFFFLGFVLLSYFELDMLGVALIGGIFAVIMFFIKDSISKSKYTGEVINDEEF